MSSNAQKDKKSQVETLEGWPAQEFIDFLTKKIEERGEKYILALPALPPPQKIHYVDTAEGLVAAAAALATCDVLGVDTETRPKFVPGSVANPTALLQVAGMRWGEAGPEGDVAAARDAPVYVFDLLALLPDVDTGCGSELSRLLAPLLASPDKKLLGVGIAQDLKEFAQHYKHVVPCLSKTVHGVIDLGFVRCEGGGRTRQGLRSLVAKYTGFRIDKKLVLSDWAARPLPSGQVEYAANDARAALMVYFGAGVDAFVGKPGVLPM